jgi:hypothetical protein
MPTKLIVAAQKRLTRRPSHGFTKPDKAMTIARVQRRGYRGQIEVVRVRGKDVESIPIRNLSERRLLPR